MYRKSIFILMVVLSFFLNCAMFSPKSFYYVVFEDNPNITNTKIYSKGIEIGKILDQELSKENKLILTLSFACLNFGFSSFGCNYPIFHFGQF